MRVPTARFLACVYMIVMGMPIMTVSMIMAMAATCVTGQTMPDQTVTVPGVPHARQHVQCVPQPCDDKQSSGKHQSGAAVNEGVHVLTVKLDPNGTLRIFVTRLNKVNRKNREYPAI